MKIDYEIIDKYCEDANKVLRDMRQEGILHDPRKTDHVKTLFSILEKGCCMEKWDGYSQTGYSGDGRWAAEGSYGRGGSYRGYSRGDSYSDRDPMNERERMERFNAEMGRW